MWLSIICQRKKIWYFIVFFNTFKIIANVVCYQYYAIRNNTIKRKLACLNYYHMNIKWNGVLKFPACVYVYIRNRILIFNLNNRTVTQMLNNICTPIPQTPIMINWRICLTANSQRFVRSHGTAHKKAAVYLANLR